MVGAPPAEDAARGAVLANHAGPLAGLQVPVVYLDALCAVITVLVPLNARQASAVRRQGEVAHVSLAETAQNLTGGGVVHLQIIRAPRRAAFHAHHHPLA